MLEAMACGTPIAAYPVTGPIDIIKNGVNGWLDKNIGIAIQKCLDIDRKKVYNESIQFSWAECYQQFKNALVKRYNENYKWQLKQRIGEWYSTALF